MAERTHTGRHALPGPASGSVGLRADQYAAPTGPYQLASRNTLVALAAARADLRTARRRVARGEERVRRWEAVLSDPASLAARSNPALVLAQRDNALRFTARWATRAREIERMILRLKAKARVTYCESKDYRRKLREAAKAPL